MRVYDMIPGMQFKSSLPCRHIGPAGCNRLQTFLVAGPHPVYPGMSLVVWKLCSGEWSFDALSPMMEMPQPGQTLVVNALTGGVTPEMTRAAGARALGLPVPVREGPSGGACQEREGTTEGVGHRPGMGSADRWPGRWANNPAPENPPLRGRAEEDWDSSRDYGD